MSRIQEPDDLNRLYSKALELHQQGQPDEAISLYSSIVNHVPDAPEVQYNLGLAYFETEQFDNAIKAYSKAAELCPNDEDILYNLGLAYKKTNRFAEAEQAYLKALALAPSDTDICYNLGCCYRDAGEIEQASKIFGKLVEMVPDHLPSLNNLAYIHHLMGEYEKARDVYAHILELDSDHASARYMHSVLVGSPVDAPPQEYIRSLFDHYSDTFEENLIEDLEYNLFLDLRVKFDSIGQKKRIYKHCLDLGCGTGLVGETFKTACIKLSGVDLSEKMLEHAEAKRIYDSLYVDEIVTFLQSSSTAYDLFVAADVLAYLGDLQALFEAAAGKSLPGALFCFSTEKTEENDWTVQPTGRYAHNSDYVRRTAADNGWTELLSVDKNTRREGDSWIKSTIYVMIREE